MGKFLKFQIRNAATATSATGSRDILINVDNIESVIDAAAGASFDVNLSDGPAGALRFWTFTLGTTTIADPGNTTGNGAVANVAPTPPLGVNMPSQSVNRALTANPGGVSSSVQLGVDGAGTPIRMYITQAVLT
jgi:hypothetical protein